MASQSEQGISSEQRVIREESECRIENLRSRDPYREVLSEAGKTEYWDEKDEQFQCSGVVAYRRTVEPKGLLLPTFSSSPTLTYIIQGRGIRGELIPGCPESFLSFHQYKEKQESQGQRDEHQKIFQFREGDIIAEPAGVVHWFYNNGDVPIVAVTIHDTNSYQNQLSKSLRKFFLAGRQQSSSKEERSSSNIFAGFDTESIAEALGISRELARKLQSREDSRGDIVRVEHEFQVVHPSIIEGRVEEERYLNGLEEKFCNVRFKENIDKPSHSDIYSSHVGRITTLNSGKLPILRCVQLTAEKGVLYGDSILAPHWNINAHNIIYITRGSGRIQIVENNGKSIFLDHVREGQIVVVPQNYIVLKVADSNGLEWVSFKTNGNAITSPLIGKNSIMRGLPEDVLMNSYSLTRDEAKKLKYSRGEEMIVLSPWSELQRET